EASATFHVPPNANGANPERDQALADAANGVRDGFSVGVDITAHEFDDDGTLIVNAGHIREVSLCAVPALDDARVTSVAASSPTPTPEGSAMKCKTCNEVHAPGVTCIAPTVTTVAASTGSTADPVSEAPTPPAPEAPPSVAASNAPPVVVRSTQRGMPLAQAMRTAASLIANGEGHRLEAAL